MTVTTLSNEFIKILHIPAAKDSCCRSDAVSVVRVLNGREDLIKIYSAKAHETADLRAAFSSANEAVRMTRFEPEYGGKQPLFGITVDGRLRSTYAISDQHVGEREWKTNMVAYAETILSRNTRGGPQLDHAA